MGSSSKVHGLNAIKRRQPHANQADKKRQKRLVAAKAPLIADLRSTLQKTSEIA